MTDIVRTGTVKAFNAEVRDFGFICRFSVDPPVKRDIFFHVKNIVEPDLFLSLEPGARVEFSLEETTKGPKATGVRSAKTT